MSNIAKTKVTYLYTDASNWKFRGEFIVKGKIEAADLGDYLFEREFFVPHEVGLDHLLNLPMNQDDHYLHRFEKFETTLDGKPSMTAGQLVSRFKKAHSKGWFFSFFEANVPTKRKRLD